MGTSSFLSWISESFSSENEEGLFDGVRYPQGFLLSDAFSEPVIETEVSVDEVASHFLSPNT
jgi:hypothetical protein